MMKAKITVLKRMAHHGVKADRLALLSPTWCFWPAAVDVSCFFIGSIRMGWKNSCSRMECWIGGCPTGSCSKITLLQ